MIIQQIFTPPFPEKNVLNVIIMYSSVQFAYKLLFWMQERVKCFICNN